MLSQFCAICSGWHEVILCPLVVVPRYAYTYTAMDPLGYTFYKWSILIDGTVCTFCVFLLTYCIDSDLKNSLWLNYKDQLVIESAGCFQTFNCTINSTALIANYNIVSVQAKRALSHCYQNVQNVSKQPNNTKFLVFVLFDQIAYIVIKNKF